ncbi:prefoldin subunit 3 [Trichomonascus vanleenenianus]|uniref:tubulin-binding prefolding complex subunit PAC10 n=1 Tax=Trichomonascus vanleenenianus TaxID=2268995 RepID=UPI003ECB1DC2
MSLPDPNYVNPRGIPQAPFVENVEEYVKDRSQVEPMLNKFQEMIQKYKYMETSTASRLAGLREKIPDIEKTLDMVRFIDSRKDSDEKIETNYELNDTLYAKAAVAPTDRVHLWLGANVMLEYTTSEAIELLESKLDSAKKSQQICEDDLEFLRENITIMQVNTARVYNWDVQQRALEKEKAK